MKAQVSILTFVLALVCVQLVEADHLRTSKEAPIRADSLSSSDIIERIAPGTLLELVDETRLFGTGYWKIKLPSGGTGYVYKTHVRLIDGDFPGNPETGAPGNTEASGELQVHVINVGQADAILIICPDGDHQLVIDSGDLNMGVRYPGSVTEFKNYLNAYVSSSDQIEVAVASHPHSDHIAGMKWLLQTYAIGTYVDNGKTYDSGTFRSLEAAIIDNGINRKRLTDAAIPDIDFCTRADVTATILRPNGFNDPGMDPNDYSVIVRVEYGSSSFLFTGDAEHAMEDRLLADNDTRPYLDVDWLKVGHHGSHSSTGSEFIKTVSPDIAAISSGGEFLATNKGYKHPRQKTIDTLFAYVGDRTGIQTTLEGYNIATGEWVQSITKKAVYITNNEGDLVFFSDGSEIWKRGDR